MLNEGDERAQGPFADAERQRNSSPVDRLTICEASPRRQMQGGAPLHLAAGGGLANSEPVDRRRVSLPLCISKWALRSLISFIQQGR